MVNRQAERTNEEWVDDLQEDSENRQTAIEALRARLERGLYYYLRNERSDLSSRTTEEVQQMTQDFVQDALLKILDNIGSFRGESRFITWASKITTRVAISELRRSRYKDFSLDYLTIDGETMPSITSLSISPTESPRPERFAEQQDVTAIIQNAIDTVLTERQRLALISVAMKGVPLDVLAEEMNTNRNALYKLIHDARLKLKKHMEAEGLGLDYVLNLFGK